MNELKIVTFEVAKAIKEAGYPQTPFEYAYYTNEQQTFLSSCPSSPRDLHECSAPTYLEVWLWLWREKGIKIDTTTRFDSIKGWLVIAFITNGRWTYDVECSDPEEAIIVAINYLVANNLIK